MSAVPNVQAHLLRTDAYILYFTEMLTNEADVFLQEFASRVLAELTSDPVGAIMYLDRFPEVSPLFARMSGASDADVKKNCIEIIDNLMKDLSGMGVVTGSKEFSFGAIYELLNQPYPIVQELALDVIEQLVMYNRNSELQENFRQSEGLQKLLDLLNHEEWNDLHSKVLRILDFACVNAATAEFMNSTDGTKRLVGFMDTTESDKLKFDTLKILVHLAESVIGKKVLYHSGIIDQLFKYTEAPAVSSEIQAVVCRGFAKLIDYPPAAEEIAEKNPVNYVINLLSRPDSTWTEKQAAAYTLKKLFNASYQNCTNFLDVNGQVHLIGLIERSAAEVPCETLVTAIQAISALADYSTLAEDLAHIDLFNALSAPFEPENEAPDELKIACCDALSRFTRQDEARRVLLYANVPRRLYNLIQEGQLVPVRAAAVNLLLQFCVHPILASLCIQEGYLFYMLKDKSVSQVIPTWGACIDALFSADLPMKFAYTGRVAIQDITEDGFYVMRRMSCPFPVLEELFRLKLCPIEIIYVVNFCEEQENKEDSVIADKMAAFEAARKILRRESLEKGIRVSEATIDAWLELKFGKLQKDPDLIAYLELFTAELAAAEEIESTVSSESSGFRLIDVPQIAPRARLLGAFVARQLSGPDPRLSSSSSRACLEQGMELHLRALRSTVGTSVIPLGMLRLGGHLERALLFKAMADRIGLPAGLVRGEYGTSWIEVAVPVLKKQPPPDDEICPNRGKSRLRLPGTYLRENYIVDLMNEPGNLLPFDSPEASRYRRKSTKTSMPCC